MPVTASAVAVLVPTNVPLAPVLAVLVAVIVRIPPTLLFHASLTVTWGCVANTEPDAGPVESCVTIKFEAAPGVVRFIVSVAYNLMLEIQ